MKIEPYNNGEKEREKERDKREWARTSGMSITRARE